jgi:hypothetical protein
MLSQVSVTENIQAGLMYGFRYRAINRQGLGLLSDETYFKAASVPAQPLPIVATELQMQVLLEWQMPDSGALPIESYVIEVLANDETFKTIEECNGSDPIVIANLFCYVHLETLSKQPYSVQQGQMFKFRVSAVNRLGQSVASNFNAEGPLSMVAPHKPPNAPSRGSSTSTSQIEIAYEMLVGDETGGSPVSSLHLEWDLGTNGIEWQTLIGETPLSTSTSFVINTDIQTSK